MKLQGDIYFIPDNLDPSRVRSTLEGFGITVGRFDVGFRDCVVPDEVAMQKLDSLWGTLVWALTEVP